MTRQFTNQDASEARSLSPVPLMIGLTGASGSGKTFSGLRLATGIQQVVGGDVFVVDTEQRRSLHYADRFKFKHVPFSEPFGSLDYLEALRYCKKSGAGVVMIDSCSHEHSGPGGMLEQHEVELTRMAGADYGKRERMTMLAWQKPKAARLKLITAITTELQMPVIFCFRAKETTKPIKDKADGKLKPVEMGFTSIGADDWLFELGLNMLFMPGSNGVPTWKSDKHGEKLAIKTPIQFRWLEGREEPIDEAIGVKLAEWARGSSSEAKQPLKKADKPTPAKKPESAPAPSLDDEIHPWEEWAAKTEEDIDARPIGELRTFWQEAIGVGEWDQLKEHDESRARAMKDRVTRRLAEARG